MNRLLRLILVIVLLIACSGCFIPGHGWVVPGDELPGDQGRGDNGGHDRGGHDGDRHDEPRR
jgi:hypothetical protein